MNRFVFIHGPKTNSKMTPDTSSPVAPTELSDEVKRKVVSILRYGKQQQKDIKYLIDSSSNKTIKRKLNQLVNDGLISKEKKKDGSVYYHISNDVEQNIVPLTRADPNEVEQSLTIIKTITDIILDDLDTATEEAVVFQTLQNQDTIQDYDLNTDIEDLGMGVSHAVHLFKISLQHYFVLSTPDLADQYFRVLDNLIEIIRKAERLDNVSVPSYLSEPNEPEQVPIYPDEMFQTFFGSMSYIHKNWRLGKEFKDFDKRMDQRSGELVDIIKFVDGSAHEHIRDVLRKVNHEKMQEAFIEMVKSGSHDIDDLIIDAHEIYIEPDSLKKLHTDLNDEKQTLNQAGASDSKKAVENIEQLQGELTQRYLSNGY